MWKVAILFLTLRLCGINGGNIYRNGEWAQVQTQPVNQPSYYSQYGPLLHDLASYQEKLYQQGLAPAYGQDLSPPFILTNNAAVNNYNPHPYNYHHETNNNHNSQSYHTKYPTATRPPCTKRPATTTTTTHPTTQKGKHNFNHIVKTDKKNENENENAKKPIHEQVDIKWPHIKHDNQGDKQHANRPIVKNLNETVKVSSIKQFIDKSVDNINKTAAGVSQQIGNESTRLIDRINKKLKTIEKQLERLKFGADKRMDVEYFEEDDDDEELAARFIPDNSSQQPNIVHSEIGKKLRSMELLSLDAELRGDLKTSISDAVRSAQERFNKLIDDQVAKINNKIADISQKFDGAFNKFTETIAKVSLPGKVSTTTVKPISTMTPTSHMFNQFTTPDYFRYTIPHIKYKKEELDSSETLIGDLNRMDTNVDALEIVDDAKSELTKTDDDDLEEIVAAEQIDRASMKGDDKEKDLKLDDELRFDDVDTAKSLDDLQSQVLANVKDTLKSDVEDLEAIENNQLEALDNPEDKLKSDMAESNIETALIEELRDELGVEDKLLASSSNIDNSEAKNSDDLAKKEDEDEIKEESSTPAQPLDDYVKSLEIDEDDDVDIDDMRSFEIPIDNSDVDDEDSQLTDQMGSFRFDELEIIQLIPVIIEQLRQGHVSESERLALEKIFGDLWPMLVAEAKRGEGEEMNPLLKTIIQSEEVRLAKRDIKQQIGNDIYKNSIRRVYRGNDESSSPKPYLALDDDRKVLSPSERLLKMVAAIVHKANEKRSQKTNLIRQKQKRRNVRKKVRKNPLGIVSVEKPRQRFVDRILGINRIKRSIVKFTTDLEDMKAFLEQVNQANNLEEELEVEDEISEHDSNSNEHLDDYVDDDYYYDDDYQMSPESSYPLNKLSWNQRNYFDDYENGSVNEFIQLAKQRDRRENSENIDENYEDDDDYEN